MTRSEAVIIDAVRTPIGKYGGVLRDVRPDDLSGMVIKGLLQRTNVEAHAIEDVMWGCANQAGEDNRNVGRMAALLAGLPFTVPGTTMNRLCGSSLDAIIHATRAVWADDAGVLIAGGVESMSRAPYSVSKNQSGAYGNVTAYDTSLGWRYPNKRMELLFPLESMGETAENIAEKYKISREEQDEFAFNSHRKAVEADHQGSFKNELLPIDIPASVKKGIAMGGKAYKHIEGKTFAVISTDEGPRADTSVEKLAMLPPVFRKNGTVTAGNSSTLNDGAAAVLIMSEKTARQRNLQPMARIVASGIAGVDPRYMGIGPVPATQSALKKAHLAMNDIDVVELNEAFAAQSIAVIRDLQINPAKLNVNGGAIALGHPLGCSGARIVTTLIYAMRSRNARFGLATMCIGVGQGIALILERM